jgi:hypothetical protein
MKKTAISELRNVWGRVGLGSAPARAETKDTLEVAGRRTKSDRTAQLYLRIRPGEKQQMVLMAARDNVSVNEIFSRMLVHYQHDYGRVELSTTDDEGELP